MSTKAPKAKQKQQKKKNTHISKTYMTARIGYPIPASHLDSPGAH
jgi:hypothetical protein